MNPEIVAKLQELCSAIEASQPPTGGAPQAFDVSALLMLLPLILQFVVKDTALRQVILDIVNRLIDAMKLEGQERAARFLEIRQSLSPIGAAA